MAGSAFKTNPISLYELLKSCHEGVMQLPDFQRSWVWDEDRIKSLIASISRAFPVGALMTLETGGRTKFKPRPIEGAPIAALEKLPTSLLLDGQQRMTSLYQVTLRGQVVRTMTVRKKPINRWFYIDIKKSLAAEGDREDAILSVPEDRILRTDFNRVIEFDYSTTEKEFENLVFPLTSVFDWNTWQVKFINWANANGTFTELWPKILRFYEEVVANFSSYQVPVIALDKSTSKEAVCTVFEKVNTGGKPLDAFELVTAMYAAEGHELRKDWYGDGAAERGRHARFLNAQRIIDTKPGILSDVANTDFLQVISLFHTRELRKAQEDLGKEGKDLPQVTGKREALLNLPLSAYQEYEKKAEVGFLTAAKFLHILRIFQVYDLPYQGQIVPLAAILADIGEDWEHKEVREKLTRWYWCGVFGELYGSAVDSRIARDFTQVPGWLRGGDEPDTVKEASFRPDRLKTMRMRLSAAYKGINILLMDGGARDFRSGQQFEHTRFFDENVDIHHIFPKAWCISKKIDPKVFDSIINKTPLSARTNRIIGGNAPSTYLSTLEKGAQGGEIISSAGLDETLSSHLIDPAILRVDDFTSFMTDREQRLLRMIEKVMGKASTATGPITAEDEEFDEDDTEAGLTMAAAE